MNGKWVLVIIGTALIFNINAQNRYTPYDDLPGINRSDKPAYSNAFPEWGKMLYEYPVDYNKIVEEFEKYEANHKGEENAITRYFINWRRVVENYVDGEGKIYMPDLQELNKQILNRYKNIYLKKKNAAANNSNWTLFGPKETFNLKWNDDTDNSNPLPWQVNVYSIDVAPSDSSIIYAGTETGYLNKSEDKGKTWRLLSREYPFGGGISSIVVHPDSPDTVYVAAGNQIHYSTNGGDNWLPLLPLNSTFDANHLVINPEDHSKMIATSSHGVFVSTDKGFSWTKKYSNKSWDVAFKPGHPDSIFVLTSNGSDKYDLIVSDDGGVSFSKMGSFPSDIYEASGGLLAVTPANKNLLYVTTLARQGDDGIPYIFKGEFDGNGYQWTKVKEGVLGGSLFEFSNGQGYFDLVLEVSPIDENVVFWGTCSLWKSTNGGVDYTRIGGYGGDFPIHPDIQGMKMLPNGETWVSTDGGVNFTSDDFATQENYHAKIEGLIGSDMWGFDQGWNEDLVVGGRYHNGNTAIADFYGDKALRLGGGESPTGWILQGYSRHAAFNDLGKGLILPESTDSTIEGRFIFAKYPNMDEYGGRRSNLLHHPNYYNILYVGEGNGIWRSTDAGVTWDLLNDFNDRVRYMQISFSNPDIIYADIVNKGLYKSEDGGITWEAKPKLTDGTYGSPSWNGKLFFAISPYDGNVVYACLSNGTWSSDVGKIFKSEDGGDTWKDWTSGLSEYMKCIVVQPTKDKVDLVYLFNSTKNGVPASVYFRRADQSSWTEFDNNFPAGIKVNLALPFYRDSKIRCAGSAGVWETPMQESDFTPVIQPWCQKDFFNCVKDTVQFDDHSMLNHAGASWHWDFYPEPEYVSDPDVRNPVVFFGDTISYDVTLTVTVNGQEYTRTVEKMVTFTKCPSVDNCNNPADIPKDEWKVLYVDSEEIPWGRYATNAIDGDPNTFWHTAWSNVDPDPPCPHEMSVDMGREYKISKFTYLPRQDGGLNGTIKDYKLYVTEDKDNWGDPVLHGTFEKNSAPKIVKIEPAVIGRYFKVVALSEVNDKPWTSAAEFSFTGCYKPETGIFNDHYSDEITAFPVPTNGNVNLSVLTGEMGKDMKYSIYSSCGMKMRTGVLNGGMGNYSLNLSSYAPGVYFIVLENDGGTKYRVKVVKK